MDNPTQSGNASDTGAGIPKDQIPHIFDAYWQGRSTGERAAQVLGLSIAKAIVQPDTTANPDLGWDSAEGKGSTFYFTLPR